MKKTFFSILFLTIIAGFLGAVPAVFAMDSAIVIKIEPVQKNDISTVFIKSLKVAKVFISSSTKSLTASTANSLVEKSPNLKADLRAISQKVSDKTSFFSTYFIGPFMELYKNEK